MSGQEQNIQKVVVVQSTGKSTAVAVILSILFGPLGMLYSTVMGGIVMLIVSLLAGIFTLGIGLVVTWPICVIWSALAASSHNKKALQMSGGV